MYAKYSGSPWIGPYRAALFVYFESQYQDACAALVDPNHQVESQVDVADFERFSETQGISALGRVRLAPGYRLLRLRNLFRMPDRRVQMLDLPYAFPISREPVADV